MILQTRSNCFFRDVIDLMFQKFLANQFRKRNAFREILAITLDRQNCFWKIVQIDCFSKNSLYSRCIECNVHTNYFICVNINALDVVARILLTWRNCSSHRIIDLMLQKFNVYINVFITFKSSSFRLFIFKTTYQIKKKLAVNCWFASTSIYRIIHIRRNEFRINTFIETLTFFVLYIQNQFKTCRNYIMSITSITSSIFYSKF